MNTKPKPVKKAIILAGGWGTRFLPLTKSVPKELLPVLDKPLIEYLVKEVKDSGIEELIIVISARKNLIIEHFANNAELEHELSSKGKIELLKRIQEIKPNNLKIHKAIQTKQLGLGHAIAINYELINDEPFAVILGDDLIVHHKPVLKQLIDVYNKVQSSIIGVQSVEDHLLDKYGIVSPKNPAEKKTKIFKINGAIEKPTKKTAPSNKAILGRYIFTPQIMPILLDLIANWDLKSNQEINVIDAFEKLLLKESIYALEFEGNRYDLGSIDGFIKANIDLAMEDKTLKASLKKHLKKHNLC